MLPFDPEVLLWTATKCTFLGFFTIAKENHHNSIFKDFATVVEPVFEVVWLFLEKMLVFIIMVEFGR